MSEDIAAIGDLLKNCQSDGDFAKIASDVEKRIHKLKGLAPMMGQEQIGEISAMLDKVLKDVISGAVIPGVYDVITNSYNVMSDLMGGKQADCDSLVDKIEKITRSS